MKRSFIKILAIVMIIGLNWTGLSAVIETFSYYNDIENSNGNTYQAGALDFVLTSPSGFDPSGLEIGESATKTISFINNNNIPKYKVSAVNFSGLLCDYLDLTANVDAGDAEYSGKLINFIDVGPQIFSEPEDWVFTLTLPADVSEDLIGENCHFNFTFFGSQIKNDLPFGQGFNDTEEEDNNIKATICYDAETRSKGYWKNHSDVYKSYLSQYLGCNSTTSECVGGYEIVDTQAKVTQILGTDYNLSMRNKLKGQLLAMKFNIAHFEIGEYIFWTSTDNFNQIVNQADNLLQQVPAPSDEILEIMKDLLDGLNQDLRFRHCSGSLVKVIIPNGGEVWWIGRTYDLTWTTKNLVCPNDSIVSIWYSKDSGATWGNITTSTENDGIYNWRIPLYLEGGTYYVPSHNARIKVVTRCSENLLVNGWDMSDTDFCPPIDYDLLLPEEIEALKAMGLYEEPLELETPSTEIEEIPAEILEETLPNENSASSDSLTETTTNEVTTIDELTTTTTTISDSDDLENSTTTSTTIPDQTTVSTTTVDFISSPSTSTTTIIETSVEESTAITTTTEPPVEEPMTTTTTEPPIEETIITTTEPPIDEEVSAEETPVIDKPLVIEETPVTGEQPVIAPVDNNPVEQALPADNSSSGGDSGGGETVNAAPSDGATE